MALSVIPITPTGEYILYDSESKCAIIAGSQDECFDWKHTIEYAEQQTANRQYFDDLRKERVEILVASGHSTKTAEDFLKKQMPYLYEDIQS